MAIENIGIAPPDPSTPVGRLRFVLGDLEYSALGNPVAGKGNYLNFSDDELSAFIVAGGDSITRASGCAYLRLAAIAASGAISWRSDDLSVDSKIPASEFRLLARIAFEQADAEDDAGASGFYLDHPFADKNVCAPELAAWLNPCATPAPPQPAPNVFGY